MSYQARNLPAERHCFFGRKGGVSEGKYASLNVRKMCDDVGTRVEKTEKSLLMAEGGRIENLRIVSSAIRYNCLFCRRSFNRENRGGRGGDENTGNGALSIYGGLYAGFAGGLCSGVIAAAHAGWRGAIRGVLENTLDLMIEKGAVLEHIAAALGPCIQQPSFEVGAEVREECAAVNAAYARFFDRGRDSRHFQFDLEGLVRVPAGAIRGQKYYGFGN